MSDLETPIVNAVADNEPKPFPTIGELVRFIARAFDIKNNNKKLDIFAQDSHFNWLTESEIIKDAIHTPLAKSVDVIFADWFTAHINRLLLGYKDLILATNVDSLKRDDILQLLINKFFVAEVLLILNDAQKKFDFPYQQPSAHHNNKMFPVVLESFSKEHHFVEKVEYAFASAIAPNTNGTYQRINKLEQFRDWLICKNIPDLGSLKLLAITIANNSQKSKTNIIQCLILARGLDWVFAEMDKHNLNLDLTQHTVDIRSYLEQLCLSKSPVTKDINPAFDFLISSFNGYKTPKLLGSLELFKSALIDSQSIILNDVNLSRGQYMIDLFYGRFYVMQGKPDIALRFYESSFKRSLYRAGNIQKQVLKELLAIAAYLADRACLKKHKAWALSFNIYPNNKYSQETIEGWEVKELKYYFYELFPKECLFQEFGDCYHYPSRALGADIIYTPDLDSQTLNLRSPNKKIQFGNKLSPQLVVHAALGHFDNVKKLLENGADANKLDLDSGGGSALLNALLNANNTYSEDGVATVVELLKFPHTKDTLNRLTDRKRLSILFEAIRLGRPDIVETILDMGADPNQRAEMDNHSPLDACIQELAALIHKGFFGSFANKVVNQEDLARITGGFASQIFDKEHMSLNELQNRNPEIYRLVEKYFDNLHRKKHSEKSLFEIARLLLIYGANPNGGNTKNYGVTPLMFAAEVRHKPMFDLLVEYKGDLRQPNSEGRCAIDYLKYSTKLS